MHVSTDVCNICVFHFANLEVHVIRHLESSFTQVSITILSKPIFSLVSQKLLEFLVNQFTLQHLYLTV